MALGEPCTLFHKVKMETYMCLIVLKEGSRQVDVLAYQAGLESRTKKKLHRPTTPQSLKDRCVSPMVMESNQKHPPELPSS